MTPILLYSHAEEPITSLILSGELDKEFNLVKLSLEELLKIKALELRTIVVSTHDMGMLKILCDRKIMINNGIFLESAV